MHTIWPNAAIVSIEFEYWLYVFVVTFKSKRFKSSVQYMHQKTLKCFPIPMSKINTKELQFIPKIWIIIETGINTGHKDKTLHQFYLLLCRTILGFIFFLIFHFGNSCFFMIVMMLCCFMKVTTKLWLGYNRWKFKTIWSESRFIPATPSAKLNVRPRRLIWNSCWIAPRPWQRSVAILLSSFQAYLSKVWLEPWNIYF